jgi:hypothetical protein
MHSSSTGLSSEMVLKPGVRWNSFEGNTNHLCGQREPHSRVETQGASSGCEFMGAAVRRTRLPLISRRPHESTEHATELNSLFAHAQAPLFILNGTCHPDLKQRGQQLCTSRARKEAIGQMLDTRLMCE